MPATHFPLFKAASSISSLCTYCLPCYSSFELLSAMFMIFEDSRLDLMHFSLMSVTKISIFARVPFSSPTLL
uniref:Uncharacterized protein n=1 Tax=Solanum lycopersicum TaxID=4081 RepID=A0A3Q7FI20_SOLLC